MNKLFIGFLVLAVAAIGIAVSTTARVSTAHTEDHVTFAQSHIRPDALFCPRWYAFRIIEHFHKM